MIGSVHMQVRRGAGKRKSPTMLITAIAIALIVGASFTAAKLWQGAEDKNAASSEADMPAAPETQESEPPETQESSAADSQPDEIDFAAPDLSDGASRPTSPSLPGSEAEDDAEQVSNAPPRDQFTYTVPQSEKVANAYFDDAIFFGDSVSTGIPLYQVMKNAKVVAYTGINTVNINTKEVIKTQTGTVTILEAAKQYGDMGKVYVMLGANGLDFDNATFIDGYRTFLKSVKAQYPAATIYVQSMLPITQEAYKTYPSLNNEKMEAYNLEIMALAKELGVNYLDVASALMDENGELPMDASPLDGVHITAEYYAKWFNYLKTHTTEGSKK